MKLKFDHINMSVKSLDESVSFYESIFDFKLYEEGISNGVAWKIIQNQDAFLCLYEQPELIEKIDQQQLPSKVDHFGIRVSNEEEWLDKIRKYNLSINYGGAVAYPKSTSWYINDPSGHEIEVSYWPAS